ncbi:DNA replication/repair protein RecF [Alcanivorax sp. 1008]|uniref:DNA replication/repair protein RecF n=1 Tax=Alcanivorax sp. 1008 TaxID=2816853 RepID=UPI001E3AE982|nr:DNA replication/repair protein RecF [Alcanivorax sp. 1008]
MLQRFHLHQFRNYRDQVFVPDSAVSVVTGENGSGKTSLLEAIYLLGAGRSFRTSRMASLIMADTSDCTLFAEISGDQGSRRIGIQRDRQSLMDARLDGQRVSGLSDIARLFPVQVLHPGTVELVEGGSSARRRYLDWVMFHVEQDFISEWRRLRSAVEQRNRLLKQPGLKLRELAVWDRQVAESSVRIDAMRRRHLPQLTALFEDELAAFSASVPAVGLNLNSGWASGDDIAQVLASSLEQDVRRGFTGKGAHRADLLLSADGGPVREVFSRGQQKIVAYALVMAQVRLIRELAGRDCLMLVDDLTSELDRDNADRVMGAVIRVSKQVIVTSLDPALAPLGNEIDYTVFHVEHGTLKQVQKG